MKFDAVFWLGKSYKVFNEEYVHPQNLKRLKRAEKYGAVEQVSVSRRVNHAMASYHGQDNYRAPTWLTRSTLGGHGWARSAPAPPEALLALRSVHVAKIGEYLYKVRHYDVTACT